MSDESDRPRPGSECPECKVWLWPGGGKMRPLHNGRGDYYMRRECPQCGCVLGRFAPGPNNELREDLKERAELDPDPPEDWPDE